MRYYRLNLSLYLFFSGLCLSGGWLLHEPTMGFGAAVGWFMAALNHWYANQIGIKTGLWKTLRDRGEL